MLDLRVRIRRREGGRLLEAETCNVEMQSTDRSYFADRLLAYASRIYTGQLERGDDYEKLYPVYSLAFSAVNLEAFASLPDDHYHLCTIRREDKDPARQPLFTQGIQFVVVELDKFAKAAEEPLDLRDAWCYLLKESPRMSAEEFEIISKKGKEMGHAVKRLWNLSESDYLREQMEAAEKQRRDKSAREDFLLKKGREEGRQEGEQKKQREIALQMIEVGADVRTICRYTGLTEKEVEALKSGKKA